MWRSGLGFIVAAGRSLADCEFFIVSNYFPLKVRLNLYAVTSILAVVVGARDLSLNDPPIAKVKIKELT
jgi:hypothetical protein